ncbi:hypothetical protein BDM02DRAFT_1946300 [Thelephora ganbajun]|uniref:Uncharacterized protein n=1 Tax=Thelephora ganbajun TaxID=370292 RepID=A0ACB6ZHA7_THEGA|nr:hypothetical protein BDM02DRAFT_1946300 [Thelephora ganbajun]
MVAKCCPETYGHVEKVISLRDSGAGKATGRSRQLARQVAGEADPGSLSNVMMEIRGNSVDPERRLKAIAANEMTGGAEEADRVRKKSDCIPLRDPPHSSTLEVGQFSSFNGYERIGVFPVLCLSHFLAFLSFFSSVHIVFNSRSTHVYEGMLYLPRVLSTTVVHISSEKETSSYFCLLTLFDLI